MGLGWLGRFLGAGSAKSIAEVFVPNKTTREANEHEEQVAVLQQFAAEFAQPKRGPFDSLVDGLNRLPRPVMAFGTIGLFVYAWRDPIGFAERMTGLATVPDQLWWLLGAIVSFYFGARELHHSRSKGVPSPEMVGQMVRNVEAIRGLRPAAPQESATEVNQAISDWQNSQYHSRKVTS